VIEDLRVFNHAGFFCFRKTPAPPAQNRGNVKSGYLEKSDRSDGLWRLASAKAGWSLKPPFLVRKWALISHDPHLVDAEARLVGGAMYDSSDGSSNC
jgi:hypothetical protein